MTAITLLIIALALVGLLAVGFFAGLVMQARRCDEMIRRELEGRDE